MRDRVLTGLTIVVLVGCSEAAGDMPAAFETGGSDAATGATGTGAGAAPGSQPNGGGGVSGGTQSATGASSGVPTTSGGSGAGGPNPASSTGGAPVNPSSGGATANPSTGGASGSPQPTTGGTVGAGGTPVNTGGTGNTTGVSTCVQGVQTGNACDPSVDTEPCVRTDRTCECGADSTWTCTSSGTNTGGASNPDNTGGTGNVEQTTGGNTSTGGSTSTGEVDCNATMPTSGGQQHSGTWAQGGSGNLAWQIWSNGGPGSITTYDVPAFTASWSNSGDYLGRMGFEWGNSGKAYTSYGTIKADYSFTKSGNAGQYSYVGIYGWSTNPCIEWYIVEDSFHSMPFNTGNAPSGTAEIDGGTYNLVHRTTSGTGGDRCGGAGSWNQYYSIRLQGKQCGTITVSDHFDAWAAKGWNLGNLLEVKIVVEAAGGQGKVDFPVANVTVSNP